MSSYSDLLSRRSRRKYEERMVSDDLIGKVLDAGLHAPSGMNTQGWHFSVVKGRKKIDELASYVGKADAQALCYGAPVFIMVSYDQSSKFAPFDTSVALMQMMNAAHMLGLGSVWINYINLMENAPSFSAYGVPDGYKVYGSLALGYPIDEPKARVMKENLVTIIE